MLCEYCEEFIRTGNLVHPAGRMLCVQWPGDTNLSNPVDHRPEAIWFCADKNCATFLLRSFSPIPGSVKIEEQ